MPVSQYIQKAILDCEYARSVVEDQEAALTLGEVAGALKVVADTLDQHEQQMDNLRQMIENIERDKES